MVGYTGRPGALARDERRELGVALVFTLWPLVSIETRESRRDAG